MEEVLKDNEDRPEKSDSRQEKNEIELFDKIKANPNFLVYILLVVIAWFGYYVRTRNLPLLIDVTNGKYIPVALDPHVFLRYAQYLSEHGQLMAVDMLRYYPQGFTGISEFRVLTYFIVYFHKFLSIFSSSITLEFVHVIYPPVAFVLGIIALFFLMRKIFEWKTALLTCAFLTVLPAYLYRTMAGFSDKEALAMVFMYLGLFLFVSFFMEKKFKKAVLYAIAAGITIALLWLTWGGVGFALLTIGAFVLLLVLIGKLSKQNLYLYSIFLFVLLIVFAIGFPERGRNPIVMLTSTTTGMLFLGLFVGWIHFAIFEKNIFKLKDRLTSKIRLPPSFISFFILIFIAIVGVLIVYGPSFFVGYFDVLFMLLVEPQNADRWALTVAESHQPYFVDWVGQFSWKFLVLVLAGAVLLFYETFKGIGKQVYGLTFGFGLAVMAFAMSRYSSGSPVFNGETNMAIFVHLGSLVTFGLYFLYVMYYLYKRDREKFDKFKEGKFGYLLLLLFFMFALLGARSAVRLLFVLAPATAMMAAYFVFEVARKAEKIKQDNFKYAIWIALVVLAVLIIYPFSQTVLAQAQYTGPSYSQQWQVGMDWVRNNTAEDSVFAHWWDYGYWVQTGGERATLSDGGNARGGINHWIGRHVLTGGSETEALEFLAAKEATHVLMISDEIGKYGAFSSIGADADYDRYSWIPIFNLDMNQIQETRNGTSFVYVGGTATDDDIVYQGQTFPAFGTGIGGFLVPIELDETGNVANIGQPQIAVNFGGKVTNIPLQCVFFNGEEIVFDEEEAWEGCLMIVPQVSGGQMNPIGSAFYLSRDVYKTVFTHLYLFDQDWEYFEQVYTDDQSFPLMIYEGRIIGPLKIWEVSYPDDLEIPEEYYGSFVPLEVQEVRE